MWWRAEGRVSSARGYCFLRQRLVQMMRQYLDNKYYSIPNIYNKLINDMLEFVKANKALAQEQANISTIAQFHSQAYYTSRNITTVIVNSECLEQIIKI